MLKQINHKSGRKSAVSAFILQKCPLTELICLGVIINQLLESPLDKEGFSWKDWWHYYHDAWEARGWKKNSEIHRDDVPLLFVDEGTCQISAVFYQFMLCAPEFNHSKIAPDGTFKPFLERSILATVDIKRDGFWSILHKKLIDSNLLKDCYSILPLNTWHVTFASLGNTMTKLTLFDKAQADTLAAHIIIEDFEVVGVLLLKIKIAIESEQNAIKSLGAFLHVEITHHDTLHISLGYQYKKLPVSRLNKIKEMLQAILTSKNNNKSMFKLMPGNIYRFNSMDQFWKEEETTPKSAGSVAILS